jgi:hypothetical protein
MNFSAILDISSFFIGMIINLLLIALICYYFKKKYEHLEVAQNEQAKVLYQLLQNSQAHASPKVMNIYYILKDDKKSSLSDLDSDESDDSDSESDSVSDTDNAFASTDKIKTINLDKHIESEVEMEEIQVQKVETFEIDLVKVDIEPESKMDEIIQTDELEEKDYSKMSIKQLKEILSVKGIVPTKMKKNEMIELIEKSSVTIDESENE